MDDHGFFDSGGIWNSENPQMFKQFLAKNSNKRAVLKVKKWYKLRTYKENRYLHSLVTSWATLPRTLRDGIRSILRFLAPVN